MYKYVSGRLSSYMAGEDAEGLKGEEKGKLKLNIRKKHKTSLSST